MSESIRFFHIISTEPINHHFIFIFGNIVIFVSSLSKKISNKINRSWKQNRIEREMVEITEELKKQIQKRIDEACKRDSSHVKRLS